MLIQLPDSNIQILTIIYLFIPKKKLIIKEIKKLYIHYNPRIVQIQQYNEFNSLRLQQRSGKISLTSQLDLLLLSLVGGERLVQKNAMIKIM